MSFDAGFDFRATSGFVTDPSYATGIDGTETYPTTRTINGVSVTFGWDNGGSGGTLNTRDRSAGVDPRLAGGQFNGNATPYTFRVDLPATGTYNIALATGDAAGANAQTNYLTVSDNTTAFITFNPINTDATHFADAAGNFWTTAAWPGSNVTVSRTFASTVLNLKIGDGVHTASWIVNLRITAASSGFTAAFRKTRSTIGTGVGKRQSQ